jgi:hypothetical protein
MALSKLVDLLFRAQQAAEAYRRLQDEDDE